MMAREHGTYVRYKLGPDQQDQPGKGCRCYACSWAQAQEWTRVARLKAAGQWQPFVDADPARRHVRALMAAGMGWKRIAAASGISSGTLTKFLYGRPELGRPASKRIRPATAAKLLAVQLDVHDNACVDATGSRRRAWALAAIGWSLSYQARRVSRSVSNYCDSLKRDQILAGTARQITALYEELSMTPAPASQGASRARREAAVAGWPPPLAWDDDTIDDPAVAPAACLEVVTADDATNYADPVAVGRACAGKLPWSRLTRAEKAEVVATLRAQGWSATRMCRHLHISSATLAGYVAAATGEGVTPQAHTATAREEAAA